MSKFPPFHARPLDPAGAGDAVALAARAGAHGVYVHNALVVGEGETLALWGQDELFGLCWFGPRGNLLVVEHVPVDPAHLAAVIQRARWPWRIALGPPAVVDALVPLCAGTPLVHRAQIYYGCEPAAAAQEHVCADVRLPVPADRAALMQATLELNQADLRVDPARVDRRWLRAVVDGRIADGSCRVLDADGGLAGKLDLGSRGPAGDMVEGVFTFPRARGRGIATALVATTTAAARAPLVCLHVAQDNRTARGAYERAGMRPLQTCRLLLLG